MIKPSDGKIGTREFLSLLVLMILIKTADTSPLFVVESGQNAAWMMPFIFLLLISVPFYLVYDLLRNNEDRHFIELIYSLLGKPIGAIVILMFFLVSIASLIIQTRSTVNIVSTLFYPMTPRVMMFFILIFASYFVANRGLEAIGRTAWLSFPLLIALVILGLILTMPLLNISRLFPFAGPGFQTLLSEGLMFSSLFSDVMLLAFIFPFVRSKKDFRFASIFGVVFSTILFSVILAVFLMVFDYPMIKHLSYPFQELTKMAELQVIVANYDSIFLAIWMIGSVIRFSIYLYITTLIFGYMLRLEEFEPLLLPFAGLIFFIGLLPENPMTLIVLYQSIVLKISSVFFIVIPIILWFVSKWRRREV
ncbi:MAG: spore germination protein [Bacillaceae bacterium]|nr:spore germination protein [Bacillaceae bacterium]